MSDRAGDAPQDAQAIDRRMLEALVCPDDAWHAQL
jgi:hypothetical protein